MSKANVIMNFKRKDLCEHGFRPGKCPTYLCSRIYVFNATRKLFDDLVKQSRLIRLAAWMDKQLRRFK